MKRTLRIVHVVASPYAGDWAFYPLKLLREAGHQVMLVCPADGPLTQRVQREGIQVATLPFPRRMRRVGEVARLIREMTRLFRSYRADVVHNHLVPANLWGRIPAWVARVPVRVTQWPGPLPLESSLWRRIELATVWMDNGIIAASSATQRIFERYWHARYKVHLIYYGFPFERFDPAIDGSMVRQEFGVLPHEAVVTMVAYMYSPVPERELPRLLMFGGLGLKGHEILIQAAAEVKQRSSKVRFLIVGDTLMPGEAERYKAALHQLASDLGLNETVIFAGKRTDVPQILAASDVIAVPSLSENVGGAVEALLMEKPVVASNVGGLPDVVIDGETGFLVPPRDPRLLADAILRAVTLPATRRRDMGRQGRKIVQSLFDLPKTVAQTESLYYELLG